MVNPESLHVCKKHQYGLQLPCCTFTREMTAKCKDMLKTGTCGSYTTYLKIQRMMKLLLGTLYTLV